VCVDCYKTQDEACKSYTESELFQRLIFYNVSILYYNRSRSRLDECMHWFDLVKNFPSKQPISCRMDSLRKIQRRRTYVVVNRRTHRRYKCFVRRRLLLLLLLVRASRMNEWIYLSICTRSKQRNATPRESKEPKDFKPKKQTPVDTF
jgi:hypothetical protein